MNELNHGDKAQRGQVRLAGNSHEKVHDGFVYLDIRKGGQVLGLLILEEVAAKGGEEEQGRVVVALVLAPEVDAVDQTHVAFLAP